MPHWYIGCSGFYYKYWKGRFYPEDLPQNKWFDFYCQHFNTLELNVTFYRFPTLPFLEKWYTNSPKNFRFSVKVPQIITHYKQFIGTIDILSNFYATITEGLQEKLGCVLFQMPPRFSYSEERLKRIITNLNSSFSNITEFRHESWWKKEVYKELGKHRISFCGVNHPSLPNDIIANTPLLYYRLHGEKALYASNYDDATLKDYAENLKKHVRKVTDAYIFFNNDANAYAVYNAKNLKAMLI